MSSHLSVPSERRPFKHCESRRVNPGRSSGEWFGCPSRLVSLESWLKAGDDEGLVGAARRACHFYVAAGGRGGPDPASDSPNAYSTLFLNEHLGAFAFRRLLSAYIYL